MSQPPIEVADVDADTLPAARAFLERYPETSLFMLSNIRAFGLRLGDSLYSGNLKMLRVDGTVRGVFCLTRGGSLLAQTAGERAFAPDVLRASREEGIPIRGVLGEWTITKALWDSLCRDGRVFRSYKDGRARIAGYLEDYAALGLAALSVYELTFDEAWLDRARAMGDAAVQWFWNDETGAFHDTASDHERLITRPREIADNATPSGTSLAVELLVRLAELLHDVDARRRATYVVETLAPAVARYPSAFGHLLGAADMLINGAVEVAIVGDVDSPDFEALERTIADSYVPSLVLAGGAQRGDGSIALLAGREARGGRATAYVCRSYTCDEPATSAAQLSSQLERMRH